MIRRPALLLCALAGLGAQRAQAAQAAQAPVDADLLEFLGSIGEDDDWQEYLEHKPVKAEAGKTETEKRSVMAKAPAKPATPPASKEKGK